MDFLDPYSGGYEEYYTQGKNFQHGRGRVDIAQDKNDPRLYKIYITVALQSGCTGEMLGFGRLEDNTRDITFLSSQYGQECRIRASLDPTSNILSLSEDAGCHNYHGSACSFVGSYNKIGEARFKSQEPPVLLNAKQESSRLPVDVFEDRAGIDPTEQMLIQEKNAKKEARERLTWGGVFIAITTLIGYLIYRRGASVVSLLRSLPRRISIPKKLKIFISAYLLWLLALLFTNNLSFEDVLDMQSSDPDRFWLLSILPLIFSAVAFVLYLWVNSSKKAQQEKTRKPPATPLHKGIMPTEVTRNTKFYFKRTAILIALSIPIFISAAIFFIGILESRPGSAATAAGDIIIILSFLVFSKPLGLWRKAACWALGIMAWATSQVAMILAWSMLHDIQTLLGKSVAESPEEQVHAMIDNIPNLITGIFTISLLSLAIGCYAVNMAQRKWREKLLEDLTSNTKTSRYRASDQK